jgi:uncharacterized SAM-binding protein YcdF (DUF218 family)
MPPPITEDVLRLAEMLWDYHHLNHALRRTDCILVLGSHDLRVAERGAELLIEGFAPLLVMSGGFGNLTREWDEPEAIKFARRARERGAPADRILLEDRSTNTGENIRFTRELLAERGIDPASFLLVQKPYMERRAWATFRKLWPEKEAIATSPQLSFREYPNDRIAVERVIEVMVGDLHRILVYPALGYQIAQDVPEGVLAAYRELVRRGFTGHLVREIPP